MSATTRAAIITGVFGLIAAALTGFVTWWIAHSDTNTQKQLAQAADRRAQEAERAHAGAAARFLIADLDNGIRVLCKVGENGYFLKAPEPVETSLTTDDRRLLATYLRAKKWQKVDLAVKRLKVWDSFYRKDAGRPMDPIAWGVPDAVKRTLTGREALERLAGYSGPARNRPQCDVSRFNVPKKCQPGRVVSGGPPCRRAGKILADASQYPCAAAVQRDGKILVVGGSKTPSGDFSLTRFLPDGRPDQSFGRRGTVVTGFGRKREANPCAVVIQPNGKSVVAGSLRLLDHKRLVKAGDRTEVVYLSDIALARYLPDGRLDPSFGRGGKVVTDLGPYDSIAAIALQPDGKIVAAGGSGRAMALLRYTLEGRLDPTFAAGGKVLARSDPRVAAVAIDRAGRIVLAGGDGVFGLARYTPDGVLDQSFGSGGIVRTGIGPGEDNESAADDLAILADGKIIAAGYGEPGTTIALARYSSDGILDETFGRGGKVVTIIGSISAIADAEVVAIQPDGRILASGGYEDDSYPCALVRYEPNGRLDTRFGKGGKVLTRFGSTEDECNAFAVEGRKDGSVVFVGRAGHQLALARYLPNGHLDPSFGTLVPHHAVGRGRSQSTG